MNFRKRKSLLTKYFGFVILLLNIHFIVCTFNNTDDKYDLKTVSKKISEKLKQATYVELGITQMQKIYDSYKYTPVLHKEEKSIEKIGVRLRNKIGTAFDVLNNIKNGLEKLSSSNVALPSQNYFIPQKVVNSDWLKENFLLHEDHSGNEKVYNHEENYLSQLVTNELTNVTNLSVEQVYFLSNFDLNKNNDYLTSNDAVYDDTYMWKLYLSLTSKKRKNLIVAIDSGAALNEKAFKNMKLLAKHIIDTLTNSDQVGVITFGHDWSLSSPSIITSNGYNIQSSTSKDCRTVNATQQHKKMLNRFIENIVKQNSSFSHYNAFEKLYKTININFNNKFNETVMLIYITPNHENISYNETASILDLISSQEKYFDFSVIINTIVIGNKISNKQHFLRDIAEKKFEKYDVDYLKNKYFASGLMQTINSRTNFGYGLVIARLFYSLNVNGLRIKSGVTLPVFRPSTNDLILSFYVPCGKANQLGLLGLNIHFGSLAEDITYFSSQPKYSYAMLLDLNGLVLMHPSFPRPVITYKQPKFVDISYYEQTKFFSQIRNLILHQENGSNTTVTSSNETIKYIWKRVSDVYIICIVVRESNISLKKIQKNIFPDISSQYNLLYHRLDLFPSPSICRHLNQMSTLDAGTVYLSAACFQSPYTYVRGKAGLTVSPLTLQSYMAYIKDNTRLLANPGLKDEVRNDVTILSHILNHLMRQHLQGALYKYIVRRYVATVNGVMQLYPGTILDVDVEPTRRYWFVHAMEHPGKIVLTSPYLDAGGAGYIVTISHTIYEGNESGQHSPTDQIVGVMAMDVTFGYIYKVLLEIVPYCSNKDTIKCFIIDDRGYLIYHPNLIDPNGKGPIEQQHIIHKESLVANDLLNHKGFIQKILCNHYADATIQRYYKFNTLINNVLTNAVHGEHCVKYYVTAVPETNTFIGIVNFTCNDVATFCPCSTVDRLCLICNRVEQNECECPCECPLNIDEHTNKSIIENPLCTTLTQTEDRPFTRSTITASNMKPCVPFVCEVHMTYDSCVGILGCEWCHLDVDGETKLDTPFCTSLTTCFHGIFGSFNPYSNYNNKKEESTDDLFTSTYSSVGPAAGSIVALCFILALIFYCYRQYSLQFMERLYPNCRNQPSVQMTSIDNPDHFTDDITNHQDKLLAKDNNSPLSPYCITTEYRKPSTAVDSDLGYSTMTPHDESERLSFTLIELDSLLTLGDDTSDERSTNTSVSAYKPKVEFSSNKYPEQNTIIPNARHCILAPVTVHRNMETI